jgi:hypothetical protein
MLGRGQVDHLVHENFDFEDWQPMEPADRRSRDFEPLPDVASDRTSEPSQRFVELHSRHRESRKRGADLVSILRSSVSANTLQGHQGDQRSMSQFSAIFDHFLRKKWRFLKYLCML